MAGADDLARLGLVLVLAVRLIVGRLDIEHDLRVQDVPDDLASFPDRPLDRPASLPASETVDDRDLQVGRGGVAFSASSVVEATCGDTELELHVIPFKVSDECH